MLGSEDVVDCGSLPAHATTLMLQGAQRCVLDAGRQKKAFRVLYHPGSYDTVESAALAARGGEARLVYLQRTSTPVAAWTMRAVLKIDACEELRVREPCTFDHGDLCLDCIGVGIAEEPCQQMETF